eukprot:XP_011668554.1 PREDICTED: carboxypeptidase A1-like [Strongylocentrotus purpuratus]
MIADVQEIMSKEAETVFKRRKRSTTQITDNNEFNYTVYHTLEEIYQWITDTANENYMIASREQLSTSHEGRPVTAIKLGAPGNQGNKPIAYIQGGIHAREWVSPATMMGLVKQDRMWRKNRRKPDGNVCTGIDLNRNYAYEWGGRGAAPGHRRNPLTQG